MNPRKRQASDPLLPTHKAPKQPRTGLLSRWEKFISDGVTLVQETFQAGVMLVSPTGPSRHPDKPERPPSPTSKAHTSLPSRPPIPIEFQKLSESQHRPQLSSSLPSNSTSLKSLDSDGAPLQSTSTGLTSVDSKLPAVIRRGPSKGSFEQSMQKCNLAGHVQDFLARLPNRPHILAREHKAQVQETRRLDRKAMLKELFQLKCEQGYTSDIQALKSLLKYSEQLEKRGLSPSRSLTELRHNERTTPRPHRYSFADERSTERDNCTLGFLARAIEKAKKTLTSPHPPLPLSRHDILREAARKKDEAIDQRIRPHLPKTLPPELEHEVTDILNKRGVVSKIAREQVTDKDLARLRPSQWLNDEIINFYGAMILSRAERHKQKSQLNGMAHKKVLDVHYFSTFFWTKLREEGYERGRLAKWTKKLDIFQKDIILIPINHNNTHWTGAAINFRRKRIESYDSMNVDRREVFEKLRQYLDLEHRNKKRKPFDFSDWNDYDPEYTPQQENGYDCGVFTCQFMESLSRGEEFFNFTQRDMAYLRKRMIWEIAHLNFLDAP